VDVDFLAEKPGPGRYETRTDFNEAGSDRNRATRKVGGWDFNEAGSDRNRATRKVGGWDFNERLYQRSAALAGVLAGALRCTRDSTLARDNTRWRRAVRESRYREPLERAARQHTRVASL
jgi:hypothetical protein